MMAPLLFMQSIEEYEDNLSSVVSSISDFNGIVRDLNTALEFNANGESSKKEMYFLLIFSIEIEKELVNLIENGFQVHFESQSEALIPFSSPEIHFPINSDSLSPEIK